MVKPPPGKAAAGFDPGGAFAPGERRADQIRQPLQDVDAHGALAADPIAGRAIKARIDLAIDRNRSAAAAGKMQQIVEPLGLRGRHADSAQSCAASARGTGLSSAGT